MIKIEVKDNIINVSGHAGFNNKGNDIVCASVSSIIYTSINAILNIDNKSINYTDNKDLVIEVLKDDDITNKLITNMLDLLKELARQYPKNIIVKEN